MWPIDLIWHRNGSIMAHTMGLLPDTYNCGLRMHRECRERFPRHRLQRKPLVSDPVRHHDTCVTHVPWCMSGSLTRGGGENVPGIPGACTTRDFTYLEKAHGLLLDGIKPLTDLMLTYRQWGHVVSPPGIFTRNDQDIYLWYQFENY